MKYSSLRLPRPTAFVLAISVFSLGCAFVTSDATAAESPAVMAKTGTKYKADADMRAVLDEFAALGGKRSKR